MKYKIIEITTPTCSVCKMLKPMLNMVMSKNFNNIEFTVHDHEDTEVQDLINEYSIRSVPAFFFMKDNVVVNTHFGAIGAPDFKKLCENLIA